jgi:hypothetical protein
MGQTPALKAPERLASLVLCDTSSRAPAEARPMWEECNRIAETPSLACRRLLREQIGAIVPRSSGRTMTVWWPRHGMRSTKLCSWKSGTRGGNSVGERRLAHHPLDGPRSLCLRAWRDAAFVDGTPQSVATGDGDGEGALSRPGAATSHVRIHDAVAKRPPPVRAGAGWVASRVGAPSRLRPVDASRVQQPLGNTPITTTSRNPRATRAGSCRRCGAGQRGLTT